MKKSLFLFAILLIGVLTISASVEEEIIGKWFVHSMQMEENKQEFDDESTAPWMEFQDENVLLLGEPGRDTKDSGWQYNNELKVLTLDSFGEELEFKVAELTDTKLVLTAGDEVETFMTIVLTRSL
jgi:hypothetical protein